MAAAQGPQPLTGATLAITAVALAGGTFMQVLDSAIANVALPTIAGDLGASVTQATWVITAFAVANGISVPLTAWCMQRFGVVRTFVVSVLLFTAASFLCGIAWDLPSLIFFRVLQGAVSGPMIPGSQALLIAIFPPSKRSTALAIWSMTTLVAPITGPVVGGYISDNFSWPWIFLINVPIGLLCAFLCWTNLGNRDTATQKAPIDTIGFALLVVWVGAFQIVFDTGKEFDWFSSAFIVVASIIAIVGLLAWLIWETHEPHPIVDLSLFKSPNFRVGALLSGLGFGVFFSSNVLMPIWLQTQMGYTATWAGLVTAPAGLVAVVLTPVFARLINRYDARYVATISTAAFALSIYLRAYYPPDASYVSLMLPILIQGIGMSGFFMAMVTIAVSGVPAHQIPQATGLQNFSRITAGAFGASLVTTLWERGASMHQTRIVESMPAAGDPRWAATLDPMRDAGASAAQAMAAVGRVATGQAYYLSTLDFFTIASLVALLLIPIIWLARPALSHGAAPAAAVE